MLSSARKENPAQFVLGDVKNKFLQMNSTPLKANASLASTFTPHKKINRSNAAASAIAVNIPFHHAPLKENVFKPVDFIAYNMEQLVLNDEEINNILYGPVYNEPQELPPCPAFFFEDLPSSPVPEPDIDISLPELSDLGDGESAEETSSYSRDNFFYF